jgi:hypothetical protein
MYAAAKTEYAAVYACACQSCSAECVGLDPCAYGMDGGP